MHEFERNNMKSIHHLEMDHRFQAENSFEIVWINVHFRE